MPDNQISELNAQKYLWDTDAALRLLKTWLLSATPSAILFAILFIKNIFDFIQLESFLWFTLHVILMPAFLIRAWLDQSHPDRLLPSKGVYILQGWFVGFETAVFMVLISIRLWLQTSENNSVQSLLFYSSFMLLPWNIMLLAAVRMLFFQKSAPLRRFRSETVVDIVKNKALDSVNPQQAEAYKLLAESKFDEVIQILLDSDSGQSQKHELIVIQREINHARSARSLDIEDPATLTRTLNRNTLTLAERIEKSL